MVKKAKDIVDRAKESLPEKANYTFRLEKKLAEAFKEYCRTKSVSMSIVIEQAMREALGEK